jgi:CubicO group peptidase (beta-lactamase class C family)
MKKILLLICLLYTGLPSFSQNTKTSHYFPTASKWEKRNPLDAGFDTAKLNAAIRFAIESESKNPRSMEESHNRSFAKEPFGEAVGPFADRGDQTGIIIYKGYIIAEWGEPSRVDMTHSVTKSFLSTTVGLAVQRGLIKNVNDKVGNYIDAVDWHIYGIEQPAPKETIRPFASTHNKKISWETMLRQTSDWEGTLWTKPDWADRPDKDSTKWHNRVRNEPGAEFEYNDVRVNAMALAATWVWKRPLPEVLSEYIMKPIGASETWRWFGYHTSWVMVDKKLIQSVSGGGHWGGGMFINAYDMARFGLLTLHKGNWNGKQLLSEKWIQQATTPTPANPGYGYMNYFLNADKKYIPAAPATAFVHVGNGTNIVYVDPENDLVMVIRWIENSTIPEFVKKVLEAKR